MNQKEVSEIIRLERERIINGIYGVYTHTETDQYESESDIKINCGWLDILAVIENKKGGTNA